MFNHMNGNPAVPDAFIDASAGESTSVASDGSFGGEAGGACEELNLKDALTKLEDVEDEYDYGCDICGHLTPAVYPNLHWMYGGSFGICDRCFSRMTDHDIAHLDMTGDAQVIDKYSSKLATAQVVNESALTEGASNFFSMHKFPLLVFEDYDTVSDKLYDEAAENLGLSNESEDLWDNEDFEAEFEKLFDAYEVCTLDDEEIRELQNTLSEFNDRMNYDERHDSYEEVDVDVKVRSGYYEAYQIFVPDEKYLSDWQIEEINKFLSEIKDKFALTQLGVAWHASNGETGYNILKESLLVEADNRDSLKNKMKLGRKFTGIAYYFADGKLASDPSEIRNLTADNATQYISVAKQHLQEYSRLDSFRIYVSGKEVVDSKNIKENNDALEVQKFVDNKIVDDFDFKATFGEETSLEKVVPKLYTDAKSNENVRYVVLVDGNNVFDTGDLNASKIGKQILAKEKEDKKRAEAEANRVNPDETNSNVQYKLVVWALDGKNPETASQRLLKVMQLNNIDDEQKVVKNFSKYISKIDAIKSLLNNSTTDEFCIELYAFDGTTVVLKAFVDNALFRHKDKSTLAITSTSPKFDFENDKAIKSETQPDTVNNAPAESSPDTTNQPDSNTEEQPKTARTQNATQAANLNNKVRRLLGMNSAELPKDKIKELVTLIRGN